MGTGIKKGVFIILVSNIINLSLSLITNFVFPKYLSVEIYADIKTYRMFLSFAALSALGYLDGMYLKYGGKNIQYVDKDELHNNVSTFNILQIVNSFIIAGIGIYLKNYIIIAFALTLSFVEMTDYFKCFFQAVGEFKVYGRVMNNFSIIIFAINMILIFVFKIDFSWPYIFAYVFTYMFVFIYAGIIFKKKTNVRYYIQRFSFNEMRTSISSGIVLMLSIFISNYMTGLDLWFVKFTSDTFTFARYAFASSTLGFLSYAISPLSITLYNYFCRNKDIKDTLKVKNIICVFAVFIVSAAFPVKFILEIYLTKYYAAYPVLFILFAGAIFHTVIQCLYSNLYKANKMQKLMFKRMIIIFPLGIVFNVVMYIAIRSEVAFAIGTVMSLLLWYVLCIKDFNDLKTIKTEIYLIISTCLFIACGILFKSYYGLFIYVMLELILSYLFVKDAIIYCFKEGTTTIMNIFIKNKHR